MSVDREELKRMIDNMQEEDTVEVLDFIGYLRMKREREALNKLNVNSFSNDKELIHQIQNSREERKNGQIYDMEQGLKYLHGKLEEFERGQNL